MLIDGLSQLDSTEISPDSMVVVGSGAVGMYLAVQLAQRGQRVVVVESGKRELGGFSDDSFEVVGREHNGIRIGRSVALGGTSNLWGGQLVEFMPVDLAGRNWLEGSQWPIPYEELTSYYPPTYEALGIEPQAQRDESVWKGIGKEQPQLDEDSEVFLTRWMKVPNVAAHFQEEVDNNPDLCVVLDATAVGFRGEGGRVSGVELRNSKGDQRSIPASQVILCAGTIENARLLLHAASDDSWDCPWKNNDNIGRYFQDHLGGRLAYMKPRDSKAFYNLFSTIVLKGQKFQPKVRLRDEVLQREPLLSNQAMIAFESSIRENLVFLKQFVKAAVYSRKVGSISELFKNIVACSRHMIPLMWKFVVEHRILIPSGSRISLVVQAEVESLPESRVMIDPEKKDAFGLPKVLLDWRLSGRELEAIQDFTLRVQKALDGAGLADLEIEPALAEGDPAFLDQLHDTNHQAGGCIMAESEAEGVVDRDLRVFGSENVYAAGPCVFRTNSNANVTFTAMTLATRLADKLAGSKHATD